MLELTRGNTHKITLGGLKTSEGYVSTATVTCTIRNREGVLRGLGAVPMTYVTDSNGDYECTISAALLMIPPSSSYKMEVRARYNGLNYREEVDVVVKN